MLADHSNELKQTSRNSRINLSHTLKEEEKLLPGKLAQNTMGLHLRHQKIKQFTATK